MLHHSTERSTEKHIRAHDGAVAIVQQHRAHRSRSSLEHARGQASCCDKLLLRAGDRTMEGQGTSYVMFRLMI